MISLALYSGFYPFTFVAFLARTDERYRPMLSVHAKSLRCSCRSYPKHQTDANCKGFIFLGARNSECMLWVVAIVVEERCKIVSLATNSRCYIYICNFYGKFKAPFSQRFLGHNGWMDINLKAYRFKMSLTMQS